MGRRHEPSLYREIGRKAKRRGARLDDLILEARTMRDPYYVSLALMDIALRMKDGKDTAISAINTSSRERRDWRRAELLVELAKRIEKLDAEKKEDLWSLVMENLGALKRGKAVSDAIKGLAARVPESNLPGLFTIASRNRGFIEDDIRTVIRAWTSLEDPQLLHKLKERIGSLGGAPGVKMLGYLDLQLKRRDMDPGRSALKEGLEKALKLDQESRNEGLNYLIHTGDPDSWRTIRDLLMDSDLPERRRLLISTAARLEGAGEKKEGMALLGMMEEEVLGMEKEDKVELLSALSEAYLRAGDEKRSARMVERSRAEKADMMTLNKQKEAPLSKKTEISERGKEEDRDREGDHVTVRTGGRKTLGLFDGYEGGIKPIHIRTLARAAPLCTAFDLDLLLIGFPTEDLDSLVQDAVRDTNVGEGGRYIKTLHRERRIRMVSWDPKENPLPPDMIATTSHPDINKSTKGPFRESLVVMGLGKRGLPDEILKRARHHLDITDKKVPLETATAMGIIAYLLGRKK